MADWIERLQQFLTMTGRELLTHAGKISHDTARVKAREEYEKLRMRQLEELPRWRGTLWRRRGSLGGLRR